MEIVSPLNATAHITLPHFNEYLAPVDWAYNFSHTELVRWNGRDVARVSELDCDLYQGKGVLLDSESIRWGWQAEQDSALGFQLCGALFLVKLIVPVSGSGRGFLGFAFHNRDAECCRGSDVLQLPVFAAWRDDLVPVLNELEAGRPVLADVFEPDISPWDDKVFGHDFFFVLFRVLMPLLNLLVVVLAMRAFAMRAISMRLFRKGGRSDPAAQSVRISTPAVMQISLVLDAAGCLVRAVYCIYGPIFSTGNLTYSQQMLLINVSGPIQTIALALNVFIFQRLSTVSNWARREVRLRLLWIYCAVAVCLELASGFLRASRHNVAFLINLSGLAYFAFTLVTGCLFLHSGLRFVHILGGMHRLKRKDGSMSSCRDPNADVKRVFMRWIVSDSFPLLGQLPFITLIFASPKFLYTPEGFFTVYFSVYSCLTLSSLFQVLAVTPRRRSDGSRKSGSSNTQTDPFPAHAQMMSEGPHEDRDSA